MSKADKFVKRLKLDTNKGAEMTTMHGIVVVSFPDGSKADFTIPMAKD